MPDSKSWRPEEFAAEGFYTHQISAEISGEIIAPGYVQIFDQEEPPKGWRLIRRFVLCQKE